MTFTDITEHHASMSKDTSTNRLLALARESGLLRASMLTSHAIPRVALTRAVRNGQLERLSRGLYDLPDRPVSAHTTLAEAARRVPRGVICLLSALTYHELTTQAPFEVWLAIDNKARAPSLEYLPLRLMRFSGPALTEGVETCTIDDVPVRITSVAKTVADCFKFRNKIGLDVALEALRDAWYGKRATSDEIWHYAKIDRVANIMLPYMESLS